ncbi:dipeptidase [Humisphaera borealis]|uniref:Membrane dipeptidase n=1 Tax=Humisphaera borealis TaxID=2807512 RepID=A0A7M2WRM6_9BACT|nr:membrane dipeptidase [Humisphaera borealis]QOV88126.1 membrane dipeptidase [Humisphaera borealis]
MLIVDAHLDLAYNALRGRDVLAPAVHQTPDEEGIPSVGVPDLLAGGVGLICATIFVAPSINGSKGYTNADEARSGAIPQLHWYQSVEQQRRLAFVRNATDVKAVATVAGPADRPLPAILLLEGADPLRSPADVGEWFAAGLRMVGLAWKRTRYAGGTGVPGPLTADGVELVRELDRFGIIHDTSHLAEASFWQLLDLSAGPIVATHSNCRSMIPTDRQLSDEMVRAIVQREGVIGINFFDKFLLRPDAYKTRRATLADVVEHMKHMCDLAGDATHVAIGTDMDGGLGREEIPEEIRTSADLPKLADALSSAGFGDDDVRRIMGLNWLRFFERAMPT